MTLLRSLAMAFSTFTKLPVPQVRWEEGSMRYLMCCFPLVGVAIGALLCLWWWVCDLLSFGAVLRAAGIALVPVAVTGGIHLDGFCDVVDAQASHAGPERRREVLKDPHVGAFAVIGVAAYLVAYLALATELAALAFWQALALLCCLHVASRCLSGIATLVFPTSAGKGMLSMFHESAETGRALAVVACEFVACAAAMLAVAPVPGTAMLVGGLTVLVGVRSCSKRQFGGMSGDIAGFLLQVAELVMLACLVVGTKVMVVL